MINTTLTILSTRYNFHWSKDLILDSVYNTDTIEKIKFSLLEGLLGQVPNNIIYNIIKDLEEKNTIVGVFLSELSNDIEYGVEVDCVHDVHVHGVFFNLTFNGQD